MERFLAELTAAVTGAVGATGYWGILVLMALESACIPIPSEIIMPFAGYLASRGELSLAGASVAGAAGCVVGSCAAYAVGARGGRPAIERWGRWVLIAPHDLELADRWFARWGRAAVFGARLLPVVRTFIALAWRCGPSSGLPFWARCPGARRSPTAGSCSPSAG